MADTDYSALMAMFGGLNQGADVNDVANFQKTVAANDIYRQVAAPVLGAKFNTSTWTPNQAIAATAAQAFLGSALNALGQRSEGQQMEKLAAVLPQVYTNPLTVATPEGVDPTAFNTLKASAIARGTSTKDAQMKKMFEDLFGVQIAGKTSKAQEIGKIQGQNEAYGVNGGTLNPEDPRVKAGDALRKELLSNPDVVGFNEIKRQIGVLEKAQTDTRAVSDLDYIYGISKILDPGSVVRQSDAGMVIESNSIPASTLGYFNKLMGGKTSLDTNQRRALFDLAKRHYDTRAENILPLFDKYLSEAKSKGVPMPETILPFARDSIKLPDKKTVQLSDVINSGGINGVIDSSKAPDLTSQLQDILTQMQDPKLTKEQRLQLRDKANALAAGGV